MERYPTRRGIAVPITEIWLPESKLNLNREKNFNNHHNEWGRRTMGKTAITQTLRDLNRHQFLMPVDVHNELHRRYSPPDKPTLRQAMDEIDEAYHRGESLKIYNLGLRKYIHRPITKRHMQLLKQEYNKLGD